MLSTQQKENFSKMMLTNRYNFFEALSIFKQAEGIKDMSDKKELMNWRDWPETKKLEG